MSCVFSGTHFRESHTVSHTVDMNEHTITPNHVPAPRSWADESIIEHIATQHPLSKDVLERYEYAWDWEKLSENEDLPWSQDLIASFEGQWDWRKLSANGALPWSEDLIACYEDRWDWGSLSKNRALPWSEALIARFEDRWKWQPLGVNRGIPWSEDLIARFEDRWKCQTLSLNEGIPWSEDLIARYEDQWNWGWLSKNQALPWSEDLLARYEDRWDWGFQALNRNPALPWSEDLIARFEDRWKWQTLSLNEGIPWSEDLIARYEDQWHWLNLSGSEDLPWSEDLIARFEDRWVWGEHGLSENEALPWTEDLIARYKDRWKWDRWGLSENKGISCSEELLARFEDRWDWGKNGLSENQGLSWSEDLIARFEDRWDWGKLSRNPALPWSEDFIARFEDQWAWSSLSGNPALPWSEDLLARFEDRWSWRSLSSNQALPWSEDLIARFEDRWAWNRLGRNPALSWSEDLITRYEDRWDWAQLLLENGSIQWSEDVVMQVIDALVRPTPLHGAASAGNVNEVKTLLAEGIDPDTGLQEEPQGEAPPTAPLLLACRYQHVDVQKALLDAGANPNVTGDDGNTPLTYAAAGGDLSSARLLLQAGAGQTEDSDSPSWADGPLYSAEEKAYRNKNLGVGDLFQIAERLHTYRRSLNQASDVDSEENEENVEDSSSGNPFTRAVEEARAAGQDMLDQIFEEIQQAQEETDGQSAGDADANAGTDGDADANDGTEEPVDTDSASSASDELALLQSCQEGNLDRARELLNMGTDPNALTPQRCATPLLVATAFGHAEIVDLLLDHGAHPTIGATAANKTCLMVAASCNEASIARALLDAGASFSYGLFGSSYAIGLPRDLSRASALGFAVESGSLETVRVILDAIFESPYTRTPSREDTLTHISVRPHSDSIRSNIHSATNVLHRAAEVGSPNIAKLLLDHGAYLKKGDGQYGPGRGKTPLEVAQKAGNDEVAKLIQDHQEKASSNQPTPSASTDADPLDSALVEAVEHGDTSQVKALLDEGAHPDGITGSGAPLVSAVKSGSRESLEALLQAGADPDACHPEYFASRTALQQAVSDYKLDMVKQLLEAGANPNIPMTGWGEPPLVYLLRESRMSKELLTTFLEAGADPNGRDVSMGDETPLHSSWANDDGADLTKLLVEAGANPTAIYRDNEEGNVLIPWHDASLVETYLELGADINALDGARRTVLHEAVKYGGHLDQIRMLLSKGADPTIQDMEGNTPLHTLAEDTDSDGNFRYGATSVLIEYGADPKADSNFGRGSTTPLRTASKEDNFPVVDAMSSYGYTY